MKPRIAYLRSVWTTPRVCRTFGYDAEGQVLMERAATDEEAKRVAARRPLQARAWTDR